ncbi:MAG: hypothetical protein P8H23_06835 [Flavobacteriaceae bacterium]|jgi:hypothetical protein|nr:hypothetical protein [Flavobacteriaceae bacterium]
MKFIHRLGFYLGGFSIGLIFLMFFLSGKKTSCAYGPNSRVLKNISTKSLSIQPEIQTKLMALDIDSLRLSELLSKGDVDFKKSKTDLDSCKRYVINHKTIQILVENCKTTAIVLDVKTKQ